MFYQKILIDKHRSSWCNNEEAEAIINWLLKNAGRIRMHYQKKSGELPQIDELVAILSPFRAQINAIKKKLASLESEDVDLLERRSKIVVGTTHALQGAERPVILFSSVITPGNRSNFLDKSPSLLNVAISRAKNTFILVCHPDIFIKNPPPPETIAASLPPTGVLSRYLSMYGKSIDP